MHGNVIECLPLVTLAGRRRKSPASCVDGIIQQGNELRKRWPPEWRQQAAGGMERPPQSLLAAALVLAISLGNLGCLPERRLEGARRRRTATARSRAGARDEDDDEPRAVAGGE